MKGLGQETSYCRKRAWALNNVKTRTMVITKEEDLRISVEGNVSEWVEEWGWVERTGVWTGE